MAEVRSTFSQIDDENIGRLNSQGMYYAWHGETLVFSSPVVAAQMALHQTPLNRFRHRRGPLEQKHPMKKLLLLPILIGAVATAVWAADTKESPPAPAVAAIPSVAQKPNGPATPLDLGPVHNGFKMGPKIISGSCPYGDAGFKALAAKGVKTILSVDGARPDAALGRKYGMRYVHIPVGYSGITRDQQLRIGRVARDLPGPIFIHCHHGIHRGPTAAVIAAMITVAWSADDALAAMKQAGTGAQYTGLWATAKDFKAPSKAELDKADNTFPEAAPLEALAASMVTIDERWDVMADVKSAGWKAPANNPDIDPPHEALQFTEVFRELARTDDSKARGADFLMRLGAAAAAATALETALRANDAAKATDAYKLVSTSCKSCHAVYRDRVPLEVG